MKIIPYFLDSRQMPMKTLEMNLIRLRVLLEGGRQIWTDNSINVKEELENNDIYGEIDIDDVNGVAWVRVDAERTLLSDFYTFEEVAENRLVVEENALLWRTFRTLIDRNIVLHPDLPDHALFKDLIKRQCLNNGQQ
jgi:hypothetical protein